MGTIVRFEATAEGSGFWETLDFEASPEHMNLDGLYDALAIGGSPFCVVLMGWLGDDKLILIGDDEALLKPVNRGVTLVRPTDGWNVRGPVLVLQQFGTPGDDDDHWGPLSSDQLKQVQDVMEKDFQWPRRDPDRLN